jgi:hypothetical protein
LTRNSAVGGAGIAVGSTFANESLHLKHDLVYIFHAGQRKGAKRKKASGAAGTQPPVPPFGS